ncbi:hypothetical protein C6P46_004014 [Rhodotorula mucilaginosa]|uniref:Branched-chain amino acid aminotransferase II n=1 Tax=Rhodotorula mucilaginosa TaxID=5537 RepID=A0A9P6W3E3_RHOMI|nr:hypothetical protein C6P46_004014 [Rhodotorula mucilaginosa]
MAPQVVPPSPDFDWKNVSPPPPPPLLLSSPPADRPAHILQHPRPSRVARDPLAFGLTETAGYVKYVWQDGAWGQQEWVPGSQIQIPVGSVALNYGASCFEGLKAFRQPDGQVKLFRPDENAKRLCHSAHIVSMPELPQDLFYEACHTAVAKNLQFVPPHAPHGAAGSLYVRPLLFASGAELVPMAPKTFTFVVWVTPTGSLYGTAGGKAPAVDAFVIEEFDRAAPRGVGHAKLAGNYAPVFRHQQKAKSQGYAITLHLDSQNRTHIDEFSTSNFIGIKKPAAADEKPTLVVPASESILKSVTTKSLIGIAESFGWQVERRPVPFQEVIDGGLSEAITPIKSITYHLSADKLDKITIGDGENAGPRTLELLAELTGIQAGDRKDERGWTWPAEGIDVAKA